MKNKIIKSFVMGSIVSILVFAFGFGGCWLSAPKLTHPGDYYGIREVGDFVVHFFMNDSCSIEGTTEQGNTKRFLIIPKKIEDSPVTTFGQRFVMAFGEPIINSEVLEKVYFEGYVERKRENFDITGCPNLKKFICLTEWTYPADRYGNYKLYSPRYVCDVYAQEKPKSSPLNPANVSYYYNYEDAENHGYYWVDDCDYGGKIEFIPSEPEREGYTFGGWYKEAECVNEWDFDNDTLPELKTEQEETFPNGESVFVDMPVYQETILYAKWIRI